jgi:hypothetical protein
MPNNTPFFYMNQQIHKIETPEIDYPVINSRKEQTSKLYNNMTTRRQKINPIDVYDYGKSEYFFLLYIYLIFNY